MEGQSLHERSVHVWWFSLLDDHGVLSVDLLHHLVRDDMHVLNALLYASILLMLNAAFWLAIAAACYFIGRPIHNFLKGRMRQ